MGNKTSKTDNVSASFTHCKINRISDRSEIISALKKNPTNVEFHKNAILIGSRAARHYLPIFRGISTDNNTDWDIICSSKFLLNWLHENGKALDTIEMITPTPNGRKPIDLYVYCTLTNGSKYDFVIPRSSTSYAKYILDHVEIWTKEDHHSYISGQDRITYRYASPQLLLILKKYMLYYSHQWEKTAKDYRELLTIASPLNENDMTLCNLFIQYNEKVFGKRSADADSFVVKSPKTGESITIYRDQFSQSRDEEKISTIYQLAMTLSIDNNILIGLEHICTQAPLWLVDYILDHWIDIQQQKFKEKLQLTRPCIQFELDNYRLFPHIPEIATQCILSFITDTTDFYSMQHVCKRWYSILRQDTFWRDLYISRFGPYSGESSDVKSWKMLYFVRLEGKAVRKYEDLEKLVDATIKLRRYGANDVIHLWEDLTHRDVSIEPVLWSKIDYVLSNAFYYQINKTSNEYCVRLIVIGLEDASSRSKVNLKLRTGEYGGSRFGDYVEQLSIEYESSTNEKRSLEFFGPKLFGFSIGYWGYVSVETAYLERSPSTLVDAYSSGLIICLFIMMVHPEHRAQFIKYLKNLERQCAACRSAMGH